MEKLEKIDWWKVTGVLAIIGGIIRFASGYLQHNMPAASLSLIIQLIFGIALFQKSKLAFRLMFIFLIIASVSMILTSINFISPVTVKTTYRSLRSIELNTYLIELVQYFLSIFFYIMLWRQFKRENKLKV